MIKEENIYIFYTFQKMMELQRPNPKNNIITLIQIKIHSFYFLILFKYILF